MLEETDAMTAPSSIDPARFVEEQLAQASPDLLRRMLSTSGHSDVPRVSRSRVAGFTLLGRVRRCGFRIRLGSRYPAVVRLWDNAWEEFIPFLDYDLEIRRVICSTNAIESLNARYRRAIKARGHFPSEQAEGLNCTTERCSRRFVRGNRDQASSSLSSTIARSPGSRPSFVCFGRTARAHAARSAASAR